MVLKPAGSNFRPLTTIEDIVESSLVSSLNVSTSGNSSLYETHERTENRCRHTCITRHVGNSKHQACASDVTCDFRGYAWSGGSVLGRAFDLDTPPMRAGALLTHRNGTSVRTKRTFCCLAPDFQNVMKRSAVFYDFWQNTS